MTLIRQNDKRKPLPKAGISFFLPIKMNLSLEQKQVWRIGIILHVNFRIHRYKRDHAKVVASTIISLRILAIKWFSTFFPTGSPNVDFSETNPVTFAFVSCQGSTGLYNHLTMKSAS